MEDLLNRSIYNGIKRAVLFFHSPPLTLRVYPKDYILCNIYNTATRLYRVFQLEVSFWFIRKIIWFSFHSIAEGLPLIMKNNIIHMTSTAAFAGPFSFDQIFHYIFAHLVLYFVDNGTNLLFEFLNWLRSISVDLIFDVTPKKEVYRC